MKRQSSSSTDGDDDDGAREGGFERVGSRTRRPVAWTNQLTTFVDGV
jgi:hypothetical protein